MGFFRQEYLNVLPFPSPGDFLRPGNELASPSLAGGFFTTDPPGKPQALISSMNTLVSSQFSREEGGYLEILLLTPADVFTVLLLSR